jgi:trigger factor
MKLLLLACLFASVAVVLHAFHGTQRTSQGRHISPSSSSGLAKTMPTRFGTSVRQSLLLEAEEGQGTATQEPAPGKPVVKKVDKENATAYMSISLSGEQTQSAFAKSCDLFNQEVKERGYKAAGFRPGAKLPPAYLYQMFGEDRVKLLCGNLLSEEIQDECEKCGLLFVGRGRITEFNVDSFTAGKPHNIEIECDLWPDISYGTPGYKGLKVEAMKVEGDNSKYEAVKNSIRERYKVLQVTPADYAATMGDVVIANMSGYEKNDDGTKGPELPAVAAGDSVEILLEKGKFMEGLIEGVVGAKAGEQRSVTVKFPVRPSGPGAALSGKEAIFDITVSSVNTRVLPEWDAKLADRIREGMTMPELEEEVKKALDGDQESVEETSRNDAIAKALLEVTTMSKIPESLVEENTQSRFQQMIMDFKEQGSTEEQINEMMSEENYLRYKEISRPNVNKVVTLGMAFRDIAEKEGIAVTPAEVQDQLDMLNAQAKQRGEAPPDPRAASDEITNVMLRRKVFNMLAEHADITWVDPPEVGEMPEGQAMPVTPDMLGDTE